MLRLSDRSRLLAPGARRPNGRWRAGLVAAILVAGAVLTSCSSGGASASERLSSWASGASFQSSTAEFLTDVTHIHHFETTGSLSDIHTICLSLGTDVEQAYLNLPTPYSTLTDELNTAYTNLDSGAIACYHASSIDGRDGLRSAVSQLDRGSTALHAAVATLAAFGVR